MVLFLVLDQVIAEKKERENNQPLQEQNEKGKAASKKEFTLGKRPVYILEMDTV